MPPVRSAVAAQLARRLRLSAAGLPSGAPAIPRPWSDSSTGEHRTDGVPGTIYGMSLPLDGITVVTVEQAVAAPLATRNLADLGARVIKVERVDGGDFARSYDHVVHGTGAHFVWLNRGKESIAVDLKTSEGCAVVQRLAARADVFVQNLAPGAAERLGLGAGELRSSRPQLVVASLSGFGVGGPMEQRKAYDMLVQAEAGLIAVTGTPEKLPSGHELIIARHNVRLVIPIR